MSGDAEGAAPPESKNFVPSEQPAHDAQARQNVPRSGLIRGSDLSPGQQCLAYLKLWYGPYLPLAESVPLWIELRCMEPQWKADIAGTRRKLLKLEYIRLSPKGLWSAARWIKEWRDHGDIMNALLPRNVQSMSARDPGGSLTSRFYSGIPIDIDAKGDKGGVKAADEWFRRAHVERGVPLPHMVNRTLSGLHLYWLLDGVYEICSREDETNYVNLVKHLAYWINGPPDEVENGRRIYFGPSADDNPSSTAATLRPVGSFKHVGPETLPHPITLEGIIADQVKWSRSAWVLKLPRPPEPVPAMIVNPYTGERYDPRGSGKRLSWKDRPWYRLKMYRPSQEFLASPGQRWGEDFHQTAKRAVSDLNWAGYTKEEAVGKLHAICQTPSQRKEVESLVYGSPGKNWEWNETEEGGR